MADVMGKGSGEQFNIEVTVNVTQAKTALAGISKSLDSITKKVGTLTSKIIDFAVTYYCFIFSANKYAVNVKCQLRLCQC